MFCHLDGSMISNRKTSCVEDRMHLVFASGDKIEVLGRAKLLAVITSLSGTLEFSPAKRTGEITAWSLRASSTMRMQLPCIMLLTIHAFVRRTDCSKQVSLEYVLESGGINNETYVAAFVYVARMLVNPNVDGLVMGFRRELWKAARQVVLY